MGEGRASTSKGDFLAVLYPLRKCWSCGWCYHYEAGTLVLPSRLSYYATESRSPRQFLKASVRLWWPAFCIFNRKISSELCPILACVSDDNVWLPRHRALYTQNISKYPNPMLLTSLWVRCQSSFNPCALVSPSLSLFVSVPLALPRSLHNLQKLFQPHIHMARLCLFWQARNVLFLTESFRKLEERKKVEK